MMKHLDEDVPPVFMILDTFDKDVKSLVSKCFLDKCSWDTTYKLDLQGDQSPCCKTQVDVDFKVVLRFSIRTLYMDILHFLTSSVTTAISLRSFSCFSNRSGKICWC